MDGIFPVQRTPPDAKRQAGVQEPDQAFFGAAAGAAAFATVGDAGFT